MNEPTMEEILRLLEEPNAKALELYGHVDQLLRAVAGLTEKNNEHEAKLNEFAGELLVHKTYIEALQQQTAPKQVH